MFSFCIKMTLIMNLHVQHKQMSLWARFPVPVFDPPRRVFSGSGLGGGGGMGAVIYPNEFCFLSFKQ